MAKVMTNTITASTTAATTHWTLRLDRTAGCGAGARSGESVIRLSWEPVGCGVMPLSGTAGVSCGPVTLSFMALLAWWHPSRSRHRPYPSRTIIVYARRRGQGRPGEGAGGG